MNREAQIEQLFEQARSLDPDERSAMLDQTCADDPSLREDLERLLKAHDGTHRLLDHPLFSRLFDGPEDDDLHEWIGRCVDAYTIRRHVATGGMGIVFEAEEQGTGRRVALKLMRPELMSRRTIRRFIAEAEILASLRHPGIARIEAHGVVEHGARPIPFYAMELITNALSITEYARQHDLSIRDRLKLFLDVCRAVHYAHQRGIIHRDLKPANILIEQPQEARTQPTKLGVPKVIDFGIARSAHLDLVQTAVPSQFGYAPGTIRYMSPEQCSGTAMELDERSDVYSLGVVLYELLTGELPYGGSTTTFADAARAICEAAPTPPVSINRQLSGELQTIVLTAMKKETAKRYQSAQELASDIQRYLSREPILARSPSRWQKSVRWVSEHPVVTTACTCLGIASIVLVLTFASVWYLSLKPHAIEIAPDGRAAHLVSIAGHVLHTWRTDVDGGIRSAELASVPHDLGSGRIALIGYCSSQSNPYPATLSAFDLERPGSEPLWIGRIQQEDLPERVRSRGLSPSDFAVRHIALHDVFPEHPGPQIVAIHHHNPYSPTAIRIYDLAGEVLFQAWHDGHIHSLYWMSEPKLLVLAGVNSLVYWEQRDHSLPEDIVETVRSPHPRVIFAIRPKRGSRSTKWTCPDTDHEDTVEPVWYRCLLPPDSSDHFASHRLHRPYGGVNPYTHVQWQMRIGEDHRGGVGFVLNAEGLEVPELRVANDQYRRHPDVPDPNTFVLGELPPVQDDFGISP